MENLAEGKPNSHNKRSGVLKRNKPVGLAALSTPPRSRRVDPALQSWRFAGKTSSGGFFSRNKMLFAKMGGISSRGLCWHSQDSAPPRTSPLHNFLPCQQYQKHHQSKYRTQWQREEIVPECCNTGILSQVYFLKIKWPIEFSSVFAKRCVLGNKEPCQSPLTITYFYL